MIIRRRTLEILSRAQPDDRSSAICDRFLSTLIIANLLAVSLESVTAIQQAYAPYFWWFEKISVTIFGCEYALRIWSMADNEDSRFTTNIGRRLGYVCSFTGLIDLIAILPSLLALIVGDMDLRWLRVLRLARLLKISHYSSALEDLISAIWSERNAFGAALYLLCIALFASSSLMYVVENEVQPDKFSSIPATMWWSFITLTTVGYGDVSPISPVGKLVGALTAMMGVCVVALLTGIVATAFSSQMARREDILEAEILKALQDGVISEDEMERVRAMQKEMGITDAHVAAIIELLRDRHGD